jgi:uncharacterized protein
MMRNILEEMRLYISDERERLERMYGVKSIVIFGSVARGEAVETSDVDMLVEMEPATFDHYMDLKFELEDRLGITVDLVLLDALKERLAESIRSEAVYV